MHAAGARPISNPGSDRGLRSSGPALRCNAGVCEWSRSQQGRADQHLRAQANGTEQLPPPLLLSEVCAARPPRDEEEGSGTCLDWGGGLYPAC